MKAVAYCRVSTDQQAEDGDSIEMQRDKIDMYCELHDVELADTFEDAGESAKDLDRPGVQDALDAVRSGEADTLIVYKLDRLTRSVRDLGALLEEFEKDGVEFVAIDESVDTSTPAGRLLTHILGAVSQWEREVTAERTSEALAAKRERGERFASEAPYGYRIESADGELPDRLVEDADEQAAISAVLAYRDAGLSLRETAKRLDEAGHEPRGESWYAQTVSNIESQYGEAA
jgi:DNA invertase Pin-like site-specific DNA recombinase